jgi:hypothetical protein
MDETKKNRRLSGLTLRFAARLAETPGTDRLLYDKAMHDLGLAELQDVIIPPQTVPFRPLHLGSALGHGKGRSGGRDG